MIKIGNEKLFSQTELLENFVAFVAYSSIEDVKGSYWDYEIQAVAAIIGESADYVRRFLLSRKEGTPAWLWYAQPTRKF